MEKWIARGINPFTVSTGDALVLAGCRYLNSTQYPSLVELAAIIGIEKIEDEAPEDNPCTEE